MKAATCNTSERGVTGHEAEATQASEA
jgi:hypothetical protein